MLDGTDSQGFGVALSRVETLHLFAAVLQSPPARAFADLLRALDAGRVGRAAHAYTRLFTLLAAEGWSGDAWRAHVASGITRDGNPFTLAAAPGAGLAAAAAGDLEALEEISAPALLAAARERLAALGYRLLPCQDLGARAPDGLAAELAATSRWAGWAERLHAHARAGGAGPFATPWAFIWNAARRRIEGVAQPDVVDPGELYGYQAQRRQVDENTERLVAGLPAQDVLLYGDRGTGKSSTVKALLTRLGPRGLRMVELDRRHLADLPVVAQALAEAPQRFVIFVDDLSFEEDETGYKDAKSALQGGLRRRPNNVRVYATSNRRHLVRERLSERGTEDDPRGQDAVQEKLSLADRFGLTVVFGSPDQELYLRMVHHLAEREGILLDGSRLEAEALRWASWHNGRSGRTARQFVDGLRGLVPTR